MMFCDVVCRWFPKLISWTPRLLIQNSEEELTDRRANERKENPFDDAAQSSRMESMLLQLTWVTPGGALEGWNRFGGAVCVGKSLHESICIAFANFSYLLYFRKF